MFDKDFDKERFKELEKDVHRIERELLVVDRRVQRQTALLYQVLSLLTPRLAKSATLTIGGSAMPVTVHLNDVPKIAVFTEFSAPNGSGLKVPPSGPVTFTSDHPEFVTVDPSTGQLAYIAVGTATITGSDPAVLDATGAPNPLSASNQAIVVNVLAVSAVLDLVDPPAKV